MRNKKPLFIVLPLIFILVIAYFTKPDNKEIIIQSVTKVWGKYTTTVEKPLYYNMFMDITSKSVHIDDWVFIKRVRYRFGNEFKTIGFGAFKHVFFTNIFL